MQIWVDADACPGEIKELLYRAAERTQTQVTLIANQALRTPRSEFVDSIVAPSGMNVADRRIVELVQPGDLVVTADIPLADIRQGTTGTAWPTPREGQPLAGSQRSATTGHELSAGVGGNQAPLDCDPRQIAVR